MLVVEETGADVVVEISPPVTSSYRHWTVLPPALYNEDILIKL